jgi:hypothetical protein
MYRLHLAQVYMGKLGVSGDLGCIYIVRLM